MSKNKRKRSINIFRTLPKGLIGIFIFIVFIGALIFLNNTLSTFTLGLHIVRSTPTPIPTARIVEPTNNPTSTPAPIAPPAIKYIAPTVDSDPIVSCNINANCGGGTQQLKQSVCSNSVCCQIAGNWYFYTDKNKCTADQQVNQQRDLNTANTANSNACILNAKFKADSCNDACNRNTYTEENGLSNCLYSCSITLESDLHSCTP